MADVKWIKLSTGLPDNRKIKQIRKLPQGDTVALMWVFLMCLAGETNADGAVYFIPEIPYTDEMLADQFAMDVKTVRLGLATFQQFGMIEIIDDIICLPTWEKWQSTDKLTQMRKKNAERQKRWYDRKKALLQPNVMPNVSITQPNAADIDKEKEQEERKELYISVISYLNEKAGTRYKATSEKTKTAIRARAADGFTLDDFKTVIDKKCAEWIGTEWEKFLRPETLFGTKFEGYLNAKVTARKTYGANGIEINENAPNDLEGIF